MTPQRLTRCAGRALETLVDESVPPSDGLFGLGLDIVPVETIRLALSRDKDAAEGWLSAAELEALAERASLPHVLAGRVAAKEAVVKALGCGFSGDVAWQDVEIVTNALGAPAVVLSGAALEVAQAAKVKRVLVSITHIEALAAATALAVR